ncbi:MAG: peptide chain release factor N(5)-glutamine methyltransferase [Clostridiales bacterium]|nr:peptide chain release factor N(5)-glutamine methyltransferase [Clostridiales bacterium]
MVTVRDIYANSREILKAKGIDDYRFEAACIIESLFNTRINVLINSEIIVGENQVKRIQEMLNKRVEGYPLQYILGEWEFYSLPFKVGEGVLIPRPDTETLVDYVLEFAKDITKPKIVDLCSGSGCIAIAIDKNIPNAQVHAIEVSKEAVSYLQQNIELNSSDVQLVIGDVLDTAVVEGFSELDIIVSNPPYLTDSDFEGLQKEIEFEPKIALYGGDRGVAFYEGITEKWRVALKKGGLLAFEIGLGQEESVTEILRKNGFKDINYRCDLNQIIRVVAGIKTGD